MSRIAYIDGCYQPLNEPAVMVEDRGYQFADGVYEVCAIRNGNLLDEIEHLERLDYSLAELNIAAPMARGALQIVMRETVRRNRVRNGILYIQVSRGVAPREHSYGDDVRPVITVTARPTDPAKRQYVLEHGIEVITVPDQRWARCDIKSISLLPNVLARQAARNAKVQEAWQIDANGLVTEGGATNAWIVDAQGRLRTRPAANDILNGITRQVLIGLVADMDIEFVEEAFSLDDALEAQECFSTASTLVVFPVISIDGKQIDSGKPGPVSLALAEAYANRS